MRNTRLQLLFFLVLGGVILLGGCAKKKVAATTPPPTPQISPAPTVSLTATPNTIERGQSTTLTWQATNATQTTIEGIGPVGASGSQLVLPKVSTTYTLTAIGPGGTKNASVRVAVTEPSKPAAQTQDLSQKVRDIFFDYDKYDIRGDQKQAEETDSKLLSQDPAAKVLIEGHCDERGSTEYNIALGENRAKSMKDALVSLGISPDRIKVISYGKEKPFCSQHDEACYRQNRRAHIIVTP